MMNINNNRVCPVCSGFSQGEGEGHCTNGHLVKADEWITLKEYESRTLCVELQTIWDGGIEIKNNAILDLSTGDVIVKQKEIDGLYMIDSQSLIVAYGNAESVKYDVSIDDTYYSIKEEALWEIKSRLLKEKREEKNGKPWSSNYVEDVKTDKFTLEVYQCGCGYHAGFDITLPEQQNRHVAYVCPSCQTIIRTKKIVDDELNRKCVKVNDHTFFFTQGYKHPQKHESAYFEMLIDITRYSDGDILEVIPGYTLEEMKHEAGGFWQEILAENLFDREIVMANAEL